jgi:hypothetical protein
MHVVDTFETAVSLGLNKKSGAGPMNGALSALGSARGEYFMKYGLAYLLGVPGVLIVAWFVINHMH